MKVALFSIVCYIAIVCITGRATRAAIIVNTDSITVQNVPVGEVAVSAFLEVRVDHELPAPGISGFQLQAKLPEGQTDVVFHSVDNTSMHPALLPATTFITHIESTKILAAKLALDSAAMPTGGGLARLRVDIAPGFVGIVPLTIVSMNDDPDFGTVIADANFAPLATTVAGATINVVIPEPAGVLLLASMAAFIPRRRAKPMRPVE